MSSSDIRSILNLPQAGSSSHHPPAPKKLPQPKKPDGISRELYALIGDNAPSLADAQASIAAVKYREKPAFKSKKVHWEWTPFTPAARQEEGNLKLGHWARVTDSDPEASVEYFGKFNNHGPSSMEYSQYEYDQHLIDPNWTPHETAYLFELLKEYDLRFIVAADRYAYMGPTGMGPEKQRSVEDMKERYYFICKRLVETRTASDPHAQNLLARQYEFDKAREIKRKQYASELFHLTAAEISEEEALYVEIKRMEQNERRFRADRDDLMRSVMGLDSGLVNVDQATIEGVFGADKNKKKRKADDDYLAPSPAPTPKRTPNAAFDNARCIYHVPTPAEPQGSSYLSTKHPAHLPVYLRSSKLPLPKPTAAIRVTELLAELGVNATKLVMPTRQNLEVLEGLLGAGAALVEMKRQVDRVEQELRTVRAQKEGLLPMATPGVELSQQSRADSVVSTDTTTTTNRQSRPL
ncbi:SWR1-complex protein 4 [Cryptococcus floricola]|uniref:SWR1-complex protein 4 n=1 Tax=Cryptococcus floricola TaxID=2591691 RepID=A0A5D3AMA2_9TREE|nr:SWR1-complex protein 4 [Cryptococcus floricola]